MVSVVLAGGGTAGHTSPLIATAQALLARDPAITLTCVGTNKGLETSVIPAAGLNLELIPAVPLPRKPSSELARVPFRLAGAVADATAILRRQRADVVVGFGGYVSLPVYFAARRLGLPIVMHEQNALPGLANKVAARFATRVLTSFPSTPLPRAEFTGLPVRVGLTELATQGRATRRDAARTAFGLSHELPLLLVSGGSLGARRLNLAIMEARDALLGAGVQILHVWGRTNYTDSVVPVTDETTGASYHPVAYVEAMEQAYAAADLMLARSGAGTVTELALVGLPAILVPLPHGNGEQALNGRPLVTAGAAIMVEDAEVTGPWLVEHVDALIHDRARLDAMAAAGQRIMTPGAAERVADVVLAAIADRRTIRKPNPFARLLSARSR